jgi:hypothetical protein
MTSTTTDLPARIRILVESKLEGDRLPIYIRLSKFNLSHMQYQALVNDILAEYRTQDAKFVLYTVKLKNKPEEEEEEEMDESASFVVGIKIVVEDIEHRSASAINKRNKERLHKERLITSPKTIMAEKYPQYVNEYSFCKYLAVGYGFDISQAECASYATIRLDMTVSEQQKRMWAYEDCYTIFKEKVKAARSADSDLKKIMAENYPQYLNEFSFCKCLVEGLPFGDYVSAFERDRLEGMRRTMSFEEQHKRYSAYQGCRKIFNEQTAVERLLEDKLRLVAGDDDGPSNEDGTWEEIGPEGNE